MYISLRFKQGEVKGLLGLQKKQFSSIYGEYQYPILFFDKGRVGE